MCRLAKRALAVMFQMRTSVTIAFGLSFSNAGSLSLVPKIVHLREFTIF